MMLQVLQKDTWYNIKKASHRAIIMVDDAEKVDKISCEEATCVSFRNRKSGRYKYKGVARVILEMVPKLNR